MELDGMMVSYEDYSKCSSACSTESQLFSATSTASSILCSVKVDTSSMRVWVISRQTSEGEIYYSEYSTSIELILAKFNYEN
jgi:hypothetical protein